MSMQHRVELRPSMPHAATPPLPSPAAVNNAGIQFVSPVADFPEDKWDDIVAVCMSSAFHASKAALPYMHKAGWGRIINTGSMHALVASPYKSAYNAAKHGESPHAPECPHSVAQGAFCPVSRSWLLTLVCTRRHRWLH